MDPNTPRIKPVTVKAGNLIHLKLSRYLPAKVQTTINAAICRPNAEYLA